MCVFYSTVARLIVFIWKKKYWIFFTTDYKLSPYFLLCQTHKKLKKCKKKSCAHNIRMLNFNFKCLDVIYVQYIKLQYCNNLNFFKSFESYINFENRNLKRVDFHRSWVKNKNQILSEVPLVEFHKMWKIGTPYFTVCNA